jgi:hypothetical protein
MAHIKAQNTHSDMVFRCFINPIQPTSKHICDIGWWEDIKSELIILQINLAKEQ